MEWDELKVHDTVIFTSYISSRKLLFKLALPEKPAGIVGGRIIDCWITGTRFLDSYRVWQSARILRQAQKQRSQAHSKMGWRDLA